MLKYAFERRRILLWLKKDKNLENLLMKKELKLLVNICQVKMDIKVLLKNMKLIQKQFNQWLGNIEKQVPLLLSIKVDLKRKILVKKTGKKDMKYLKNTRSSSRYNARENNIYKFI